MQGWGLEVRLRSGEPHLGTRVPGLTDPASIFGCWPARMHPSTPQGEIPVPERGETQRLPTQGSEWLCLSPQGVLGQGAHTMAFSQIQPDPAASSVNTSFPGLQPSHLSGLWLPSQDGSEWRGCDRDHGACKVYIVHCPRFTENVCQPLTLSTALLSPPASPSPT